MKKIGLIIKNTRMGEEIICQFNARANGQFEQWASGLPDARDYIKKISGFDRSGKIAYVIKFFGENGMVVGIIKTGNGRAGDNITAWLHVPADIDMAKLKIVEIIQAIEEQFSSPEGLKESELAKYFVPEYPIKDNLLNKPLLSAVTSKSEGRAAYCCYGTHEELKYLFDNIAQKGYGEYQVLFFLYKADGFGVPNGQKVEISSVNKVRTVFAPNAPDKYGFKPAIMLDGKRVAFDKEYETYEDEQLTIIWEKPHHEAITVKYKVPADNNPKPSTPDDQLHYYLLTKNDFKITERGENKVKIDRCTIKVNDKILSAESGEKITLEDTSGTLKVRIKVTCNGYKDYEREHTINTRISNALINVQLERLDREYKFIIPVEIISKKGKKKSKEIGKAEFTINTKSVITESPVKGYDAYDDISERYENRLEYKRFNLKWCLIGLAAGIVVSVVAFFILFKTDFIELKDDAKEKALTEEKKKQADEVKELKRQNREWQDSVDKLNAKIELIGKPKTEQQ